MAPFVILLVVISTFMHAGWNLLARFEGSERDFYSKMLIVIMLAGLIPAVTSEYLARSMTPVAWLCVVGSGVSAGVYLFFLARAYESSDFTIVYPVARALPVIFVAAADVLRGRYLTTAGWFGVILVATGVVFVPLRSFKDFSLKNYFNRTTLWMLLAAMGTIGYTLLDKLAAESVQQGPATAARYGYFYFAISYLPYLFLLKTFKKKDEHIEPTNWKLASAAAALSFAAYWLILWAYQLTPYAGYIVAFRQLSIVIGAALAFKIFKERGVAVRMTGAFLIAAGLILIAVWGR
ncbi:MAG: EamA family transporter [Anaerolineales bacterium]|nr:EamA family transporter [Anaerolineales bacterium]